MLRDDGRGLGGERRGHLSLDARIRGHGRVGGDAAASLSILIAPGPRCHCRRCRHRRAFPSTAPPGTVLVRVAKPLQQLWRATVEWLENCKGSFPHVLWRTLGRARCAAEGQRRVRHDARLAEECHEALSPDLHHGQPAVRTFDVTFLTASGAYRCFADRSNIWGPPLPGGSA